MTGPRFIAPDRHRRKVAAVRALILLRQQYGVRAFRMTRNAPDGTRYRALDTGTEHGPRCSPECTWCKRRFGAHA